MNSKKDIITITALEKARSSLKTAFAVSASIGLIIILGFLSSDNDKYAFWLLLIPMVGYVMYGNQIATKYRYLPDFSDSVYYLGFTFTLMSLLGATIFEKLSADPTKTISYFGMALSTTILGLLYRTYHSQFTDVNSDPIEKANEELAVELSNFKENLNDIMNKTKNALEIFEKDIPERLSRSLSNLEGRLVNSFVNIEKDLNELDETFSGINQKISTTYSEINNRALESSIRILETFENLGSNTKNKGSEINKILLETVNSMEEFNIKTNDFINQIVGNESMIGSLNELAGGLSSSISEINKFSEKVKGTTGNFNMAISSLNGLTDNVKKQIDIINTIFNDANKVLQNRLL